jgi:hypothetical protein
MIQLTVAVFALIALFAGSSNGWAYAEPSAVSVVGKDSVTFVISGLSNATGFGGHFSAGSIEDGWGGTDAECHFIAGDLSNQTVTMFCFDGYLSNSEAAAFRLDLGVPTENKLKVISHATITVTRRGVQVDVTRLATSTYNSVRKAYTISSFFPLRESTGFFQTGKIYYEANGVIAGVPDREGEGYIMETPVVR